MDFKLETTGPITVTPPAGFYIACEDCAKRSAQVLSGAFGVKQTGGFTCGICDRKFVGVLRYALRPLTCAEETGREIIRLLKPLSADERGAALSEVDDEFCHSCGREHGGGRRCQCWNDE